MNGSHKDLWLYRQIQFCMCMASIKKKDYIKPVTIVANYSECIHWVFAICFHQNQLIVPLSFKYWFCVPCVESNPPAICGSKSMFCLISIKLRVIYHHQESLEWSCNYFPCWVSYISFVDGIYRKQCDCSVNNKRDWVIK